METNWTQVLLGTDDLSFNYITAKVNSDVMKYWIHESLMKTRGWGRKFYCCKRRSGVNAIISLVMKYCQFCTLQWLWNPRSELPHRGRAMKDETLTVLPSLAEIAPPLSPSLAEKFTLPATYRMPFCKYTPEPVTSSIVLYAKKAEKL